MTGQSVFLASGFHQAKKLLWLAILTLSTQQLAAQEPEWIWSPKKAVTATEQSQGVCFFRKKFKLIRPEKGELHFAAGDEYEIYVNGKLASRGQSFGSSDVVDVSPFLEPGTNLIAAKVQHFSGQHVGLATKLRIKEKGELDWRSLLSDSTWKTHTQPAVDWAKSSYRDIGWLKAKSMGQFALNPAVTSTAAVDATLSNPSHNLNPPTSQTATSAAPDTPARFETQTNFVVQSILPAKDTGSLLAIEFNEFGNLILAKEGAGLLLAQWPTTENKTLQVRPYCDQVTDCHGILPINGNVYVTGQGPAGLGLYKLSNPDATGKLQVTQKLLGFTGEFSEIGPHGLQLGPDGMIYVSVGRGSQLVQPATSNHAEIAETEDQRTGSIIRVSLDGSKIETVADGLYNAHDLVFDENG